MPMGHLRRESTFYGLAIDTLIDVHQPVLPHIDEISRILLRVGADHVSLERIDHRIPGQQVLADFIEQPRDVPPDP